MVARDRISRVDDDRSRSHEWVEIKAAVVGQDRHAIDGLESRAAEWLGLEIVAARPCGGGEAWNERVRVGEPDAVSMQEAHHVQGWRLADVVDVTFVRDPG